MAGFAPIRPNNPLDPSLIITFSFGQSPQWINYTNTNSINSLAIENEFLWIGTNGGLVKFNKNSGEKVCFNKANSGLPYNHVTAIYVDSSGNKWIGTSSVGLAKFNNFEWQVFNTSNSQLPDNSITSILYDYSDNLVWIGTQYGGLINYDGENWKIYNSEKNIWIGTNYGLLEFDGLNWTVYDTLNNGEIFEALSLAVDSTGIWIGMFNGLAKFDFNTRIISNITYYIP